MSILAILGVIISSAAMLIVLSGFSGLKSYSLEFISSISPEFKISAAKGKTFEFTPETKSFLEIENMISKSNIKLEEAKNLAQKMIKESTLRSKKEYDNR